MIMNGLMNDDGSLASMTPMVVARLVRSADQRMAEASDLFHASGVLSDSGDEICIKLFDQADAKRREALAIYEFALTNGAGGNC